MAGWLKRHFPRDSLMRVPHETFYWSLFIQACGVLKGELTANLRSRRTTRRSKATNTGGQLWGEIIDGALIGKWPGEITDPAISSHR
jgi:hypothetical protein